MAGDHEGAECRDDIAAIEPASAAGCQQRDPGHCQGDSGHIDPPDPVAPDDFCDHRNEEYEEIVEDAGPRDAGPLDAKDETEVGQPEGDANGHATSEYAGIQFPQASGADQQHDKRGQSEPGQDKQLRRNRGDTDLGEQKAPSPEEGSQHQKKIYPVHGGCGRGCHRAGFSQFAAKAIYSPITGRSAAAQSSSGIRCGSIHCRAWCSCGVMMPPVTRQVNG